MREYHSYLANRHEIILKIDPKYKKKISHLKNDLSILTKDHSQWYHRSFELGH